MAFFNGWPLKIEEEEEEKKRILFANMSYLNLMKRLAGIFSFHTDRLQKIP